MPSLSLPSRPPSRPLRGPPKVSGTAKSAEAKAAALEAKLAAERAAKLVAAMGAVPWPSEVDEGGDPADEPLEVAYGPELPAGEHAMRYLLAEGTTSALQGRFSSLHRQMEVMRAPDPVDPNARRAPPEHRAALIRREVEEALLAKPAAATAVDGTGSGSRAILQDLLQQEAAAGARLRSYEASAAQLEADMAEFEMYAQSTPYVTQLRAEQEEDEEGEEDWSGEERAPGYLRRAAKHRVRAHALPEADPAAAASDEEEREPASRAGRPAREEEAPAPSADGAAEPAEEPAPPRDAEDASAPRAAPLPRGPTHVSWAWEDEPSAPDEHAAAATNLAADEPRHEQAASHRPASAHGAGEEAQGAFVAGADALEGSEGGHGRFAEAASVAGHAAGELAREARDGEPADEAGSPAAPCEAPAAGVVAAAAAGAELDLAYMLASGPARGSCAADGAQNEGAGSDSEFADGGCSEDEGEEAEFLSVDIMGGGAGAAAD